MIRKGDRTQVYDITRIDNLPGTSELKFQFNETLANL